MEPSELITESDSTYGITRNDGRSIHHRNELEKTFAAITARIMELKEEVFELGKQESRNFQIGGA
jgi:hypothetical protein